MSSSLKVRTILSGTPTGMGVIGVVVAASSIGLGVVEPTTARAQGSAPVCMAGVTRDGTGSTFTFATSARNVAGLEARGFAVMPCNGEDRQQAAFHQEICKLANIPPSPVQQRFEAKFGISPAELCALTTPEAEG